MRVDCGAYQGYRIPPYYDSLIGKLIVYGKTRTECLMRLKRAWPNSSSTASRPPSRCSSTWSPHPDIVDGLYDIHWLEKFLQQP